MSKTNYELLVSKSKEELASFLSENVQYDDTPWEKWFNRNYCKKCEPITLPMREYYTIFGCSSYAETMTCAYCELKGKCKFFPDMNDIPDTYNTILMWLEDKTEEEIK